MKKRYVLAALAAMVVLAGCGGKASTDNTDTQNTQDAQDDSAAASMDDDELSELDPEFSRIWRAMRKSMPWMIQKRQHWIPSLHLIIL